MKRQTIILYNCIIIVCLLISGHCAKRRRLLKVTLVVNFMVSITLCQSIADRYRKDLAAIYYDLPQRDEPFTINARSNNSCIGFSNVNYEKREFYSPGYPGSYPSMAKCTIVLKAPTQNVIKLDFRERFDVEQSTDCRNDYLEIRDGPYGYNKLLEHRFCGSDFPPLITSSDRHLWIHFASDENIEKSGFKAVFYFVNRTDLKRPEKPNCSFSITNEEEGRIEKKNISQDMLDFAKEKNMAIDCVWAITVRSNWKIHLQFEQFQLVKPNDCDNNFVDVFSNNTDIPSRISNFCGSIADSVASSSNVMYIRFYVESIAINSTFLANFTAFRDYDKVTCTKDEFDCEDATCISRKLKCNGKINCRFRWDEDNCDTIKNTPLSEDHIIIIMVIFSLILSGMCFTFVFNCVKKLIRDHRAVQEHIRQSREQQLNELGKQEQMENKHKVSGSHSNSTHSSDSRRFSHPAMTNTTCYVPGGDLLPILIRNEYSPNGDPYSGTVINYDNENTPQPEMCDSACQTRESLFTTHAYSSTHSTPNHSMISNTKPSPPAPFSTFGYRKENKYRAEAKIEVERVDQKPNFEDKRRPYSVQTTKSAPDVIVTH